MAGVAVYYTMPHHVPLDCWYYLWDAKTGGTGKSTHMRMFTGFFSKYLTTTGWKTFTGVNDENGEWLGKIGVECEEAGVNRIKDVEAIKSRTSGGWELKKLYAGRMSIRQPLLLISLANVKPLFEKTGNSAPIWERLQPCEFTQKLRNSGKEFPCSEEEYNRALLNVGCWVAYKLMRAGKSVSKQDLPYYVTPEENERLSEFVPWKDVLLEIGTPQEEAETPLNIVFARLRGALEAYGYGEALGAPELRSQAAFRAALDGTKMQGDNHRMVTIWAKGRDAKHRDGCKFVVRNYKLKDLPLGKGDRRVDGYYIVSPNGKIEGAECDTEDATKWNIMGVRGEDDPYPERGAQEGLTNLNKKTKCTFVLTGNTVRGIE